MLKKVKKQTWIIVFWGICVVLFASFLRLYKIYDNTEFLGDQGSAGVVLMESLEHNTIPLVGPTVSTGQRPGPFYYYLISLPYIITRYHPLAPAVVHAILGAFTAGVVYVVGVLLYAPWIGLFMGILYGLSPVLVHTSQTSWNPNSIPFFISLIVLFLVLLQKKVSGKTVFLIGLLNGIVIQLHYTNMFTLLFSVCTVLWILTKTKNTKKGALRYVASFIGVLFAGFILANIPFVVYESMHSFENTKSLFIDTVFKPFIRSGAIVPKTHTSVYDLSSRLIWHVVHMPNEPLRPFIQLFFLFLPFVFSVFWGKLFVLWFILGLIFLTRYTGSIPDHYLRFLEPFPFFIVGSLMYSTKRYIPLGVWAFIAGMLITSQVMRPNPYKEPVRDIERVSTLSQEMSRLAGNEPFAFTLYPSRSFSDYHYRFFFRKNNVPIENIDNNTYPTLFIVCDKQPCVERHDLEQTGAIPVLCYDHVCEGDYGMIDLAEFSFDTEFSAVNGKIFKFTR